MTFSGKNIDDVHFKYSSFEDRIKKVLLTGKHISINEEERETLKKNNIPVIENSDLDSYLSEMASLKGNELIECLISYEQLAIKKSHLHSDKLVNFSALLLSEYVKKYGQKEIVKIVDDIPPRFFNEIKEEVKDISSNQGNHHLYIKAFLDIVPAQLNLFNEYFYKRKDIDALLKEGPGDIRTAKISARINFIKENGPVKTKLNLHYFTPEGKYAELYCLDTMKFKGDKTLEVIKPFSLNVATKDGTRTKFEVGDRVSIDEGFVITKVDEGYYYPEHFKHSKKFYEILFSHKNYEEVEELVKEFEADCQRIFLKNYKEFVKGEYEELNLGQWYTDFASTLEENEKNILVNDMKIYVDKLREELTEKYIDEKSEAPQFFYINEILYGVLDKKDEGYRLLECLDRLNDENFKYVLENFDELTTKNDINSRVLLDKYKVLHTYDEKEYRRAERIHLEDKNKCLTFIEKNLFKGEITDLSLNLAIYKLLKEENLNEFTYEEKEAINTLTNGHAKEFFEKIKLPQSLDSDIWQKYLQSTKADVEYYDKDLQTQWLIKYWDNVNEQDKESFILDNCNQENLSYLLDVMYDNNSKSFREAVFKNFQKIELYDLPSVYPQMFHKVEWIVKEEIEEREWKNKNRR